MNSADIEWTHCLRNLLWANNIVTVRGRDTLEFLNNTTKVDMTKCVVTNTARKLSYGFMANEALWILSGSNKLSEINLHAPSIGRFSDDGLFMHGAYGPKVVDQLSYVANCIAEDINTRQAYMNIWREKPGKSKDIPCTLGLHFVVRDGYLNCFDYMRSSDIWLGWPYDVFSMSMISLALVIILKSKYKIDLKLGVLYLTASSQHLYYSDLDKAKYVINTKDTTSSFILNENKYSDIDDLLEDLRFISYKSLGSETNQFFNILGK